MSGFVTTRGSVLVGGELWNNVTVLPKATRTVTVQYRRAGTAAFTNASTGHTSTAGLITLGLRPPGAGTWQFRVVVSASAQATALTSPMRTVVASGHAARTSIASFATASATIAFGTTALDDVVILPRAARFISVQALRPGASAYVTQSVGMSSGTGHFRAAYRPTIVGTWRFRLVVRTSASALSVTSPSRSIRALDRTPPGPVTTLNASGIADRSATLSWTNPTTADFTGVMIRRAVGAVAPTSATGTLVTDAAKTVKTFTDSGLLTAQTTYTYAAFAHDAARNFAAAAKVTLTTKVADPVAPGPVTGLQSTDITDTTIAISWTNPADADLAGVVIRRAVGATAPATVSAGTAVASLDALASTFTDTGLAPDTQYSYAIFTHDLSPNYSPAANLTRRTTTAPDVTAPGPVTGLHGTASAASVALSWTNPATADFAGVVIRRDVGATAPATVADGTAVTDLPSSRNTFTDTCLTPGTQYSYAVFAHDGTPNYAAGATLTVTTDVTGPTAAVLSVNPLLVPSNKLTLNTTAAFDAGCSFAAGGTTLVSGTLDYGDGQTDTFTGASGPSDFWNSSHAYASTGPKTVTLTVTDSVGTSATATVDVTVFDLPTATVSLASGPPSVGAPATFALTSATPAGTQLTSYELFISGADTFTISGNGPPPANQDITFAVAGDYTVQFTVTNDAAGTSDVSEIPVQVAP